MDLEPVTPKVLVVYREISEVQPYALAVAATGAEPLLEEARPGLEIGSCSGLLLTGGGDVDTALYGEARGPETEAPDRDREAS